jgi:predicted amidohydrolase
MPTERQVWPEDPADLFVELYYVLPDRVFTKEVSAWYREHSVQDAADRVHQTAVRHGSVPQALTEDTLAAGDRGIFAALWGLDQALADLNPFNAVAADVDGLSRVARRYARTACLNTDPTRGRLLFACAFPGRPVGLPKKAQFFSLVMSPPASDFPKEIAISHQWIWPEDDLIIHREHMAIPHVRIACVPMLGSLDDVILTRLTNMQGYRVAPNCTPSLIARCSDVLRAIDQTDAHIGLLPESSLSEELLEAWKSAMIAVPSPPAASLTWLLVGTGPTDNSDPPRNRAVLFNRKTAKIILTYDKLFDFTLDDRQIRQWGLDHQLGRGPLHEDLLPGDLLKLYECSLGRITFLICEDLTRTTATGTIVRDHGASHVFVPIFSGPMKEYSWERGPAQQLIFEVGSWVVVLNSLAIRHAGGAPERTCVAYGPHDTRRDDWHVEIAPGAPVADPAQPVVLNLPAAIPSSWASYRA